MRPPCFESVDYVFRWLWNAGACFSSLRHCFFICTWISNASLSTSDEASMKFQLCICVNMRYGTILTYYICKHGDSFDHNYMSYIVVFSSNANNFIHYFSSTNESQRHIWATSSDTGVIVIGREMLNAFSLCALASFDGW